MPAVVLVYSAKNGDLEVVDWTEAKPFESNKDYKHVATLDASALIKKILIEHPEIFKEVC